MVTFTAPPSVVRWVTCTSDLPKVGSPTTSARPLSFRAPVTISDALALLRSTSTVTGTSAGMGSPSVFRTSSGVVRPLMLTTVLPDLRKSPATFTASSTSPPGSPRRSSTTAVAP